MELTVNQQYVLAAMQQADSPLSAYALLEKLRKPGFSAPAQVYRALDRLMERGLVHRVETLNAYVTCSHPGDCKAGFSAFAICDSCGHTDEFPVDDLGLRRWAEQNAFVVESAVIEIHGQCCNCTQQTDAENKQ